MFFAPQFLTAVLTSIFFLTIWGSAQAGSAREKDYQDWRLRCEQKNDEDPELCFILQIAKSTKEHRTALRIGVRYPEPNKPAMVFLTLPARYCNFYAVTASSDT